MIGSEIRPYLTKVCTTLNSHDVDYIIVGGAAVSHYGYNRPSGIGQYHTGLKADLDFWYNPTIENFQKILGALHDLDVDTTDLKKLVFDNKRTFLKIPHEEFHTDFLPVMLGLDSYRTSKRGAEETEIDGVKIHVLSLDDLILNKAAVRRKTDLSDITELKKIQTKKKKRGKHL